MCFFNRGFPVGALAAARALRFVEPRFETGSGETSSHARCTCQLPRASTLGLCVAQELAVGDARTGLFASTPPLFLARTMVYGDSMVVDGDERCAFLDTNAFREIYMERASQDPLTGHGKHVGRLKEGNVRNTGRTSTLTKGARDDSERFWVQSTSSVSDIDDLLTGETSEDLLWVKESIKRKCDIKETGTDSTRDGLKFLGRRTERQRDGFV